MSAIKIKLDHMSGMKKNTFTSIHLVWPNKMLIVQVPISGNMQSINCISGGESKMHRPRIVIQISVC